MTANLLTRTRSSTRLQIVRPLASLWFRFCAALLEQAILLLAAFAIVQSVGALLSLLGATVASPLLAWITVGLYGLLVLFNYLVLPLRNKGQTLGMQLVGIRIVRMDDEKLTAGTLLLRHLLGYPLSLLPLALGFITAALDSDKQGWHDKIADTKVIADPRRTVANLYPAIVSSFFIHVLVILSAIVLAIIIPLLLQALHIQFPDLKPEEPPPPPVVIDIDQTDPNLKPRPNAVRANHNSVAKKRNRELPTDTGVRGAQQSKPTPRPRVAQQPPAPAPEPEPKPEVEPPKPKPVPVPKLKAAPPPSPDPILPKPVEPPKVTSPELSALKPEPAPDNTPPAPAPPTRRRRTSSSSGSGLGTASALGGPLSASSRGGGNGGLGSSGALNPGSDGPGSGVDAQEDIDWGPYMAALQRKVKRNWITPEAGNSRRTVLVFSVSKSGDVTNLRVARSSGSRSSDDAAIDAVQRAAPFARLPVGYKNDRIDIQFTFDINVFGATQGDF
ncbi:TonB family protein [Gloeobacter kilaueensis]|uniref:Alpha-ketoglutarate decarboxylase n=1 Tax=Gloeobacter kilaueensis (strain ATCC BAA-2537 / CCAP 1431/1 / ULC 316 / JS1) TaxID=1183438 RepID=U5QH42_GLOK1|nr:TonB family protein [Gloeobacter kilaueensis]AGY56929.1 alpha-ketoglutarate decarboxylase [Gloeobacter kilaueensis JS1]